MSELPESWEVSTVGEIATVQLGRQRSPKNHTGPHMRPYLRSANVTWSGIDTTDVKEMNFDPGEAATFELRDGDILLNEASGSPGEVGKPAIWRNEIPGTCFQNTLLRVRSVQLDEGYLYWYFYNAAFTGRFGEAGRGVNIRHLGKQGLAGFPIPVPPLPEQRRIVNAIEEHLSHLNAAEAEVRRALQRLGSLWDAALDSALRDDWRRTALDDLNNDDRPICYGILKPKTEGVPAIPYVEVRSISGGRINVDRLHRTTSEMHQQFIRSELRENDVVLAIRGSFDRAAVVPRELAGANVSRDVARIAPKASLLPAFLALFLESREAMSFFRARARGVAVQGINIGDLRRLPVPVPSPGEQDETVRFMACVSEQRDTIRAELDHAANRASLLRSAILAAAFSGRLVAQDLADEPASVLLGRIAVKRAAAKPSRKKNAAS